MKARKKVTTEQTPTTTKASQETLDLANVIIEAIKDKKGENIITLDLSNIEEAVAKIFIVCDAQTSIQTSSIAKNVIKEVELQLEETPYHADESDIWNIVDYADVVVHIFRTEDRRFYDIEGVWMDAIRKEYN